MSLRHDTPAHPDRPAEEPDDACGLFATTLRAAVRSRGLSLRAIRRRLAERGHAVSVATLSFWQSGARRPERPASIDVVRELEHLFYLDEGHLTDTLGPSRRVRATRHETFATMSELRTGEILSEPDPELLERSGVVGVFIDATGRISHTVTRTLWQARRDGARDAAVFYGPSGADLGPRDIRGTMGCDLVDVVADPTQHLIRATLRLHSPLLQGELALTERRSVSPAGCDAFTDSEFTIVALRRQAEFTLYATFDPRNPPRRCRVTVDADGATRMHTVSLNGGCATHAEFGFGPGKLTLHWEW